MKFMIETWKKFIIKDSILILAGLGAAAISASITMMFTLTADDFRNIVKEEIGSKIVTVNNFETIVKEESTPRLQVQDVTDEVLKERIRQMKSNKLK
jgi:hypothetical protein